jgi:hypothetical protein
MNSDGDTIESSKSLVAPKIARPLAPGWLASDGDPDADAVLPFFLSSKWAGDALAPSKFADLACQTAGKQRVRGMMYRSWHFLAAHFSLLLGVHAFFVLSCPSIRRLDQPQGPR